MKTFRTIGRIVIQNDQVITKNNTTAYLQSSWLTDNLEDVDVFISREMIGHGQGHKYNIIGLGMSSVR